MLIKKDKKSKQKLIKKKIQKKKKKEKKESNKEKARTHGPGEERTKIWKKSTH